MPKQGLQNFGALQKYMFDKLMLLAFRKIEYYIIMRPLIFCLEHYLY